MDCEKRHGTDIIDTQSADTLEECMNHCGAAPFCSSVDYDQKRKKCYLSNDGGSPQLDAKVFASAHSVGCSGACEKCKTCPTPAPPPDPNQCIEDEIVDAGGYLYRKKCSVCYHHVNGQGLPAAKTHEECMAGCAATGSFTGANWLTSGTCYCKPNDHATLYADTNCVGSFVPLF